MKNKKTFFWLFLCSFAVFLCFSCSLPKEENSTDKVFVTNTKTIHILPTSAIDETVDTLLNLSVQMKDSSFSTPIYVYADETVIYITILNDFGFDMGILQYDGEQVYLDCSIFPDSIKPVYLINEFQNGYYKSILLKDNMEAAGLTFTETENKDGSKIRLIKSGTKQIEKITISKKGVQIDNFLRGYKITLENVL